MKNTVSRDLLSKNILKRPTKYVLKYGMSLKEIAKIFGVTRATIYNWVREDKKRKWMEDVLKEITR